MSGPECSGRFVAVRAFPPLRRPAGLHPLVFDESSADVRGHLWSTTESHNVPSPLRSVLRGWGGRRWPKPIATTTLADFSLHREPLPGVSLFQARGEISPGKTHWLSLHERRITGRPLIARASRSLARSPWSAPPRIRFLYVAPQVSLPAAFGKFLAVPTLRFARVDAISSPQDFHLLVNAHAGHTRIAPRFARRSYFVPLQLNLSVSRPTKLRGASGNAMPLVTDADVARLIAVLSQDVEATLGPGHEARVRRVATHIRDLRSNVDEYIEKVVEDVQQELHDLFIDTTWPACPLHRRHPLWLHDGHWTCTESQVPVAPLGQLR